MPPPKKRQNTARKGHRWTESAELTNEAVASLLLQHLADVAHAADGELVVVEFVSRSGSGVHDVVALLFLVLALGLSRGALGSRVVLSETTWERMRLAAALINARGSINSSASSARKEKRQTHRGAKVVSHFVSERDVGDFGRNVGGVILHGDDASVQRLLLPIRVQLAFLADPARAP